MMSIALESNTSNRIHGMPYIGGGIYDSTDSPRFTGDRRFPHPPAEDDMNSSSSSSSIGRNSDLSDGDRDSGDGEVQSSLKGPLSTLDALEQVLPIKRGISTFYSGKSKSYTSLADAESCSDIKDIVKPEDAYSRKRKNMLALSFWDKNRNFTATTNSVSGGAMSKRLASSSRTRSTTALGQTSSTYETNTNSETSNSNSSSSTHQSLPPLPPNTTRRLPSNESLDSSPRRTFTPWRSFSLSDLQQAADATPTITDSVKNNKDKKDKLC